MNSTTYSFYRADDGHFTGARVTLAHVTSIDQETGEQTTAPDLGLLALNTPDGCVPMEGAFDYLSQRVDLETGEVVAYAPPPAPIAELRAAKLAEINDAFEAAAAVLTVGYPPAERLTWPTQQAEALAWGGNTAAPTPYLDGVAAARGITPEEMRAKTLASVQQFMAASQYLVGVRQALRDAIDAATTAEDLGEIQWPL